MELYLCSPPSLLVRLGVIQQAVLWELKKSLYGLRCAPKRWSTTRDECIKTFEINDDEWGMMRCIQCPTFKNVWKVVSSLNKEVLGFFMVYVDDVI
eukprot:12272963-Prorocentrum_lima.AAC.1